MDAMMRRRRLPLQNNNFQHQFLPHPLGDVGVQDRKLTLLGVLLVDGDCALSFSLDILKLAKSTSNAFLAGMKRSTCRAHRNSEAKLLSFCGIRHKFSISHLRLGLAALRGHLQRCLFLQVFLQRCLHHGALLLEMRLTS